MTDIEPLRHGPVPGPRNLITDVPGLLVGHATDEKVRTGVTTLLCAGQWAAAADVRGGGPGGREIEALQPGNLVDGAHAVVLAGGSVFGLAAADGVTAWLSANGRGLRLRPGSPAIPIVPSAVLHDLANGGDKHWALEPPYRALGLRSAKSAGEDFALGAVGAGRGAMAGTVAGGLGSASIVLEDGLVIGALVAANPLGSVHMADGKTFWAWPWEQAGEFGGHCPGTDAPPDLSPLPDQSRLASMGRTVPGANTTLAIVACNADLDKTDCKRVAMMAHDGMARAVRPAHTPFDGDTVFALAGTRDGMAPIALGSGAARQVGIARIGSAAADCLARAIARAVHHALQSPPATGVD